MSALILAAVDEAGGIGKDGAIPWGLLPTDMQRFRALTSGVRVLVGTRTWDGLPLDTRVAILRRADLVTVTYTAGGASLGDDDHVVVIGGGHTYTQAVAVTRDGQPWVRQALITRVKGDFNCDVHFPKLGSEWALVSVGDWITERGHTFRFEFYTR